MKIIPKILLVSLSALMPLGHVAAQIGAKKDHDRRIERLLDTADFKVGNRFDGGRTHWIFVNSNTQKYGNLDIREIWSAGFISDGELTPAIMRKLLKKNGEMKLGSWKIANMNGKEVAVFYAQIAADTDKDTLLRSLQLVSEAADEMEKELTGKDDL
jgi:hypothetical protein